MLRFYLHTLHQWRNGCNLQCKLFDVLWTYSRCYWGVSNQIWLNVITPTSTIGQNLSTCPEPNNITGKYAVAVLKDRRVEGQLSKEKPYQYTKTIFYFLQANYLHTSDITVKEKRVNYGDGQSLQILCTINFIFLLAVFCESKGNKTI